MSLAPKNKKLIEEREIIQKKLTSGINQIKIKEFDKKRIFKFFKINSYLLLKKKILRLETSNVDDEISSIAGPQLVVPVDNARYALNAANARWGSLYDALYGTDVIPGDKGTTHNEERAKKVVNYVRDFLDEVFILDKKVGKNIIKNYYRRRQFSFFCQWRKKIS